MTTSISRSNNAANVAYSGTSTSATFTFDSAFIAEGAFRRWRSAVQGATIIRFLGVYNGGTRVAAANTTEANFGIVEQDLQHVTGENTVTVNNLQGNTFTADITSSLIDNARTSLAQAGTGATTAGSPLVESFGVFTFPSNADAITFGDAWNGLSDAQKRDVLRVDTLINGGANSGGRVEFAANQFGTGDATIFGNEAILPRGSAAIAAPTPTGWAVNTPIENVAHINFTDENGVELARALYADRQDQGDARYGKPAMSAGTARMKPKTFPNFNVSGGPGDALR